MPFTTLEASGGTHYDAGPEPAPDAFGLVEPARTPADRLLETAHRMNKRMMGFGSLGFPEDYEPASVRAVRALLPDGPLALAEPERGAFGRLAVDPAKLLDVAKGVGHAVTGVTDAAGRIMRDYRPGSGEFGDEMARDSIIAGPGALLPGFGRAAGGLGAAGGQPPKVTALIEAWRGKPEFEELADKYFRQLAGVRADELGPAVNKLRNTAKGMGARAEREAENIFQGIDRTTSAADHAAIAERAAAWQLYQKTIGGEFELGAMGGAGRQPQLAKPPPPDFGVSDVTEWANAAGLKTHVVGKGESKYLRVSDPEHPGLKPIEIRFPPADQHMGNVYGWRREGDFIELGTQKRKTASGSDASSPSYVRRNEAGEPFTVWDNLTAALKERFSKAPPGESWMTAPGSGVRGRQKAAPGELGTTIPEGQADLFPQLRDEVVAAAQADTARPAKEIIRDLRARHGEGGLADSTIVKMVSEARGPARTAERFGPLNDSAVEDILIRSAQGGAQPAEIVRAVKDALGMAKTDPAINKTMVADKLRELEAKGRVMLYGAGVAAATVMASGDGVAAQDGKSDDRPPLASPDDQLIFDTQALTAQARQSADDVPYGRFSFGQGMSRHERARWAEFTAMANGLRNVSYAGSAD